MRTLVHIRIAHEFRGLNTPEIKNVNGAIRRYYERILVPEFLVLNQEFKFNKFYLDSYDGSQVFRENTASGYLVSSLKNKGMTLMPTEHPDAGKFFSVMRLLSDDVKDTFELLGKLKELKLEELTRIEDIKEILEGLNVNVSELFRGIKNVDFHRAREMWIGRNINRTLNEAETGALFLGSAHPSKYIRKQLRGVEYYDTNPFSFLDKP